MSSQYATFILPLATGGEEEEVLNHFLRSHRILQIRHQLVERETGAVWFFLVEYQGSTGKDSAERESSPVDYRDVLNPEEFGRFRSLRE